MAVEELADWQKRGYSAENAREVDGQVVADPNPGQPGMPRGTPANARAPARAAPAGPWQPTRSGQRVKFHADLPPDVADRHEAGLPRVHRSADGLCQGVYTAAYTDVFGVPVPEKVTLLDEHGHNVTRLTAGGPLTVWFAPEDIKDSWQPLLDVADLPPGERRNPDWVPAP